MKTATFIKKLTMSKTALNQALYKLSTPVKYTTGYGEDEKKRQTSYVVVSTIISMYSGLETYIFPANSKGDVLDWLELYGSMRMVSSHAVVLKEMGYKLSNITK